MNWVNDVGAPLAVTAIDLGVESMAPGWNEWASYIVAGGAYASSITGFAKSDFIKNMGIAALPWAAKNIYSRVRGGIGSPVRRLSMSKVSRWPAPLVETPFEGARLV